ncbi:MAG TPA: phosphotransferase [Candidatus Limnocylindria bacterium]|nr:phosphotransferase [Candidatus Limnocylindria bacterium]
MDEVPFIGGNMNDATRVGETVRRRAGPWTPAVHALLRFLENAGFEAPRARGIDDKGREILEHIDGDAHPGWPDPAPDWVRDDDHLAEGARLLRRYHDLVEGFVPPTQARWRFVAPTAHEIICHNDWAPWNALFRERRLAVMLDWDMAGPGTRLWDIANSAYSWVPLFSGEAHGHDREYAIEEQARRLRMFCDAYGLSDRGSLLDVLKERTLFVGGFISEQAGLGDKGAMKLADWDVPARMKRDAAYQDKHRAALERALT